MISFALNLVIFGVFYGVQLCVSVFGSWILDIIYFLNLELTRACSHIPKIFIRSASPILFFGNSFHRPAAADAAEKVCIPHVDSPWQRCYLRKDGSVSYCLEKGEYIVLFNCSADSSSLCVLDWSFCIYSSEISNPHRSWTSYSFDDFDSPFHGVLLLFNCLVGLRAVYVRVVAGYLCGSFPNPFTVRRLKARNARNNFSREGVVSLSLFRRWNVVFITSVGELPSRGACLSKKKEKKEKKRQREM